MLNSRLSHEFKTFGGYIGAARQICIRLKCCVSNSNPAPEHKVQLQELEHNLEMLLRQFQRMADEYSGGDSAIDLEQAKFTYLRGVHEWQRYLGQLLQAAGPILDDSSITDSQTAMKLREMLQILQQIQPKSLNELLEKD